MKILTKSFLSFGLVAGFLSFSNFSIPAAQANQCEFAVGKSRSKAVRTRHFRGLLERLDAGPVSTQPSKTLDLTGDEPYQILGIQNIGRLGFLLEKSLNYLGLIKTPSNVNLHIFGLTEGTTTYQVTLEERFNPREGVFRYWKMTFRIISEVGDKTLTLTIPLSRLGFGTYTIHGTNERGKILDFGSDLRFFRQSVRGRGAGAGAELKWPTNKPVSPDKALKVKVYIAPA